MSKQLLKNGLYQVRDLASECMPIVAEITDNDGVQMRGTVYYRCGDETAKADAAWVLPSRKDSDAIAKCIRFGGSNKGTIVVKYDITREYKLDHPSTWFVENKEPGPYPVTVGEWEDQYGAMWTVDHVSGITCVGHNSAGTGRWWVKNGKNTDDKLDYRLVRRHVKKKLRPWKPEEVPIDAWFRTGLDAGLWFKVCQFNAVNGTITNCDDDGWTPGEALAGLSHSTDGGKTWKRCGVEEEA